MSRHHHQHSSLWIPSGTPVVEAITKFSVLEKIRRNKEPVTDLRHVLSNSSHVGGRYCCPNAHLFKTNRISTTKYTVVTFIFKNLYEQLHRWANWFFIMILVLNYFKIFAAFNRFLGIIPVVFIFTATAVKDMFEDLRRYRMDKRVNESTCHVWDHENKQFRRMQWQHVLVGDFVHITNNELFPADILLLRSAENTGTCFIETSNLDGETSLKQKSVPKTVIRLSEDPNAKFHDLQENVPNSFHCMHPSKSLHEMCGFVELPNDQRDNFAKENMLWRGCRLRNTTFIEGIVLYTGPETKVMLNNGRPKAKRSDIEVLTNRFILFCFVILIFICMVGSLGTAITTANASNESSPSPFELMQTSKWWLDGLVAIGTFIINYQVLVPLSLYITVELIKLGLVFLMQQDVQLYYAEKDQRVQVRNLTIPESLGQITHVLSDKTGTVTENVMIFRRCAFDHFDYGTPAGIHKHQRQPSSGLHPTDELQVRVRTTWRSDNSLRHFFTNLAICNTVVVNREHKDVIEVGEYEDGVYMIDNSSFYTLTAEDFARRQEEYKIRKERAIRFRDEQPSPRPTTTMNQVVEEFVLSEDEETQFPNRLSRVSTFSHTIRQLLPRISSLISSPGSSVRNVSGGKRSPRRPPKKDSLYEAESPDELALVEGASQYSFTLLERSATHVTLRLPSEETCKIEVLRVLPFDATRKRMSIIVKEASTPILYTKGADSSIFPRLRAAAAADDELSLCSDAESEGLIANSRITVDRAKNLIAHYANKGLRTLAYGMRELSWEEYREFAHSYDFLEMDTTPDRDKMLAEKADQIERELRLLGVTGVEDKLQDGVAETIKALREAGIQVWLLTGDKLETAENIARSCGLFDTRYAEMAVHCREDVVNSEGIGCVNVKLDPEAIAVLREKDATLLDVVRRSASVLCYRMTPSEKSEVVACVKNSFKGHVLAIGDGANDVPMIQAAHVGVGVSGNEGMQAVMASDFAIARFSFLKRLLLVHGHWNYDRIANTYLYFLYKNALLVFIIFFCQFYSRFSGESPMDPVYSMLYSIIFTSVQPIVYGIYDQSNEANYLLRRPAAYKVIMNGACYNTKLFVLNMVDAFYQALICYYVAHMWAYDNDTGLWAFGYVLATSMFLVNTFHLALEVRCWTFPIAAIFVFFTVLHFVFFLAYDAVVGPWSGLYGPPIFVSFRVMTHASFYIVEVLTVVVALTPRLAYRVYLSYREGKIGAEIKCCMLSV